MLTVRFVINEESREYTYNDSQRDIANALVKTLREDEHCTSLMCIRADGTVVPYKKESEKCFAVKVIFGGSSKAYTYGSKTAVKANDEIIVSTWEGLKVVKCIECTMIEQNNLQNLTNGKKPQWILGKFTRF